jgi:alkylation response protein AidB-like acyl-CoA dehydrogenase
MTARPQSTWQRLCPQPAWQHPLLSAIEHELDRSESIQEIARAEEEGGYPEALIERLHGLGAGRFFAEAPAHESVLTEWHLTSLLAVLARRSASLGVTVGVKGVALLPVYIAGTPSQQQQAFAAVLEGASGAILLTEWTHGSDLLSNDAFAERGAIDPAGTFVPVAAGQAASHYRLSGQKCFINEGARARLLVALARTRPRAEDPPGPLGASSGLSLFLIDRRGEAARALPRHRTLSVPASDISGVDLDGVVVPADRLLGREGEGFYVVQRALSISRGGVPPLAAGLTTRACELARAHARSRVLYGAPIAGLEAIAEHLVRMEALDRVVNAMAIKGAALINVRGQGAAYYTAVCKLAACQLAEDAVTEGRRLFGAHGLAHTSSYERVIRDVVLFPVFDGTRHVMLDQIQARLQQMATAVAPPEGDPLEPLRAAYRQPPSPLVVAARKGGRPLVIPVVEAARALAALPGETPLALLVRAAEALMALTRALIDSGRWQSSQAQRFGLAEALALLEALLAFVELHDPDRRPVLAPPMVDVAPRDRGLHRFALGWLGAALVARIREIALCHDLPLDPALLDAERDLLRGQAAVRGALFRDPCGDADHVS